MNNQEIIERNYAEAVKGLKDEWFSSYSPQWYEYVIGLPAHLLNTYLTVLVDNQVYNGGFDQYFVNGYGQFAIETIQALQEIGAIRKADLLRKAYERINIDGEENSVFRQRILNKKVESLFTDNDLNKFLNELDNEYYETDQEDIEQLLGNYLMFP